MGISALSLASSGWAFATRSAGSVFSASSAGDEDSSIKGAAAKKTVDASAVKTESATDEFLKWAKMNPVERLRAQYLKDHNLTEEKLAAMPTEERQKIEDDIKKQIEKMLNDKAKQKAIGNLTMDV